MFIHWLDFLVDVGLFWILGAMAVTLFIILRKRASNLYPIWHSFVQACVAATSYQSNVYVFQWLHIVADGKHVM